MARSRALRVVARFQYLLPETQTFTGFGRHVVAISPDGTKLVYVANRQLYLRELNRLESEPIRGTLEAPAAPVEPVFSPDGLSVAYFTTVSEGMVVKRVPIAGGTPIILGRVSGGPLGVTWRNHTIAFGRGAAGIEALPDTGGEARTIASVDAKTERAVQPELLDGGEYVVFGVPTHLTRAARARPARVRSSFSRLQGERARMPPCITTPPGRPTAGASSTIRATA